jgi:ectoine hydroxylase-related dioxygenase (phytanoyl-CoA dioxygenase family)
MAFCAQWDGQGKQSGLAKPVCADCIPCGQTRWCIECPETKAAKEAASLVCSFCMSGPACVPPEAAASVDPIDAAMQAHFHMNQAHVEPHLVACLPSFD